MLALGRDLGVRSFADLRIWCSPQFDAQVTFRDGQTDDLISALAKLASRRNVSRNEASDS
jgi:hypothetical protein